MGDIIFSAAPEEKYSSLLSRAMVFTEMFALSAAPKHRFIGYEPGGGCFRLSSSGLPYVELGDWATHQLVENLRLLLDRAAEETFLEP